MLQEEDYVSYKKIYCLYNTKIVFLYKTKVIYLYKKQICQGGPVKRPSPLPSTNGNHDSRLSRSTTAWTLPRFTAVESHDPDWNPRGHDSRPHGDYTQINSTGCRLIPAVSMHRQLPSAPLLQSMNVVGTLYWLWALSFFKRNCYRALPWCKSCDILYITSHILYHILYIVYSRNQVTYP